MYLVCKCAAIVYLVFCSLVGSAQVGGIASFDFLNLSNNARLLGVGGVNVSLYDEDVNQWSNNPALLNSKMAGRLSANVLPYFAGTVLSSASYAWTAPRSGTWGVSLQHLSYGEMDRTDQTGNTTGTFKATDYAFTVGKSAVIEQYALGLNLRFAGSSMDGFNATALMADIGGLFIHPDRDFKIGLSIRNVGTVLTKYTTDSEMSLPFQVVAGASVKPQNMPARLSMGVQYLQRYDIVFLDPNKPGRLDANGNEIREEKSLTDLIGRHLVLGVELLLSKNFHIRAGYNYLRRRELRLEDRSGGAGLSIGAFVRAGKFDFGLTRAFYHVAGGTTAITVSVDLHQLGRKKEIQTTVPGEVLP
jgi:hypothetical protein